MIETVYSYSGKDVIMHCVSKAWFTLATETEVKTEAQNSIETL